MNADDVPAVPATEAEARSGPGPVKNHRRAGAGGARLGAAARG